MAITWAQRLKRVFAIDIEICRECGGAVKVIACIEDPEVIKKILTHLTENASSAEAHRHPQESGTAAGGLVRLRTFWRNQPTRNVAGEGDTTVGIQEVGQRMERFAEDFACHFGRNGAISPRCECGVARWGREFRWMRADGAGFRSITRQSVML